MSAVVDSLTVLTSISNKHAGKRFKFNPKTGQIRNRSYDSEKFFAVSSIAVGDIIQLGEALTKLSCKPCDFVIRGEPLPGINHKRARRILHPDKKTGDPPSFKEVPRHCFIVDVDHIPRPVTIDPQADPKGAVEYVIGLLPPELHDGTCWWQFSSTQGVYPGDETLSLHLWFWNLDPLDDAALTRWALAVNQVAGLKLIDPTLYRAVQPHYITAPAFDGMADPLPRRCGLRQGLDEAVSLVIPPAAVKHPDEPSPGGYEPGLGIEAYLAKLGGPPGFRAPIVSAIASYISVHGSAAAREPIKQLVRAAIARADHGGRSPSEIERYESDKHLDEIFDWVLAHHGDQPPKGLAAEPPPHIVDPEIPIAEPENEGAELDARPPEYSDEALALRFAGQQACIARFVKLWGEWLLWNGTHWRLDDTLHSFDMARAICRIASAEITDPSRVKLAAAIASAKTVAAVITLARSDRRHAVTTDVWDADLWNINCKGLTES